MAPMGVADLTFSWTCPFIYTGELRLFDNAELSMLSMNGLLMDTSIDDGYDVDVRPTTQPDYDDDDEPAAFV